MTTQMPGPGTATPITTIEDECVNCGRCVKECAFLGEYGSPKRLAEDWPVTRKGVLKHYPFQCSLCGLCHGVCPQDLDPSAMFLAMRRSLVESGEGILGEHKKIRSYEKLGSSPLLSWFHIPEDCNTVLFPGCALPGSRPRTLLHLYRHLQKSHPTLGLVLECCTKPSHDLGDSDHFQKMFSELCSILLRHSVKKVLVACPNCYRIFKEYGSGLEVETVYELLAREADFSLNIQERVTVHDPCGVRFASGVQESSRELLQQQGLEILEMKHNRATTICCGEGGSAGFVRPDFAISWITKRVEEAGQGTIISYCAGCTHFLGKRSRIYHLLDLLFFPEVVFARKHRVSRAPFTYWNRFRLKQHLKKRSLGGISGSRKRLR